MAFTITMLSWSTIEFKEKLEAKRELSNALKAIKWGTDYLMKAHNQPRVLYGQVGDVASDHACWQRPEDMTTPRTTFHLDDKSPGSDLAAETAAALAAASIAFRPVDDSYATQLLHHAIDLFAFAVDKPGLYQDSFKASAHAYSSSGYDDEMVWAAAWLERASGDHMYMDYISRHGHGGLRQTFCWDDKYVGAQILVAKGGVWEEYKEQAEKFICACAQKGGGSNVKMTRGGLLWFLPWDNIQYVATATFSLSLYAKYLDTYHQANIKCQDATLTSADLTAFVKSQV
ncbi:endoglucanase 14-like [Senna tora]|uniref:cellulase n=1 Tax=Senna tora TaxID=362788 RepID=A0A834T2T7_9FABA|nr:endoglucanase 14-like [Senna tora]